MFVSLELLAQRVKPDKKFQRVFTGSKSLRANVLMSLPSEFYQGIL